MNVLIFVKIAYNIMCDLQIGDERLLRTLNDFGGGEKNKGRINVQKTQRLLLIVNNVNNSLTKNSGIRLSPKQKLREIYLMV